MLKSLHADSFWGIPAIAIFSAVLLLATPASAEERRPIVLGRKEFAGPYGKGWGTQRPSEIYNGGDPAAWSRKSGGGRGEGASLSVGEGKHLKSTGGYYRDSVAVKLRASTVGRCEGRRAYLRLWIRAPSGREVIYAHGICGRMRPASARRPMADAWVGGGAEICIGNRGNRLSPSPEQPGEAVHCAGEPAGGSSPLVSWPWGSRRSARDQTTANAVSSGRPLNRAATRKQPSASFGRRRWGW